MIRCSSCGEDNPERFRFCGVCGASLAAPAGPRREMRKTVTVVFADIAGSTVLGSQLDPEAMRRQLSRHFAAMREILERHGGSVEKFIGDAVMAVFGVPAVHEDDALRAVRAADEMRAAIERLNAQVGSGPPIELRMGVNTGEVVTGDPATGETLVTGDAVNVAARLEQAAAPGEILIGALTWQLVRDAVDATAVAPLIVKGKDLPVTAHRLERVRAQSDGRARRHDSPLVDRERELRTLRRAFEDVAKDRRCHLVTLLGPAGMGKTRVLAELLATTAAGARTMRGRCLPYGEGITFWPLREIVRDIHGPTGSGADPTEPVTALAHSVAGSSEEADRIVAALSNALGLSIEPVAREELFWGVRRLLERLASEGPVIVAFDDLQWAEPMLLDLIESIADLSREAPILLVCSARPEFLELRPTWAGGKLNATTMLLEPLPEAAMDQLLANLVGAGMMPSELRRRVLDAADGLPLYVEELVGMLADQGAPSEVRGTPTVADIARLPTPPTVQQIVAARLELLEPGARSVLERAAVIGRTFDEEALLDLCPADLRPELPSILADLVRKELVRPDGGPKDFRFRHLLVRDTAYAALPKDERATLHRRFAARLAGADSIRTADLPEIVGYHLEQAHIYLRQLGAAAPEVEELAFGAATALALAGRRAFGRRDSSAAASLLSRAIALLPDGTEQRLALELVLAEVTRQGGELTEAMERLERTGDRAREGGFRAISARAEILELWVRGSIHPREWNQSVALLTTRLEPDLIGARDDESLSLLWGIRLDAAMSAATLAPAQSAATQAIAHAARVGDPWQIAQRARATLAEIAVVGAESVTDALADCFDLQVEGGDDRRLASSVLGSIGRLFAMSGQRDAAQAAIDEALGIAEELNLTYARAFGAQAAAFALRVAGDSDAAIREARRAFDLLAARGDRRATARMALDLAELLLEAGSNDDARAVLEHVPNAEAADDREAHAFREGIDAILAAIAGDADGARALAGHAVRVAGTTDSPIWRSKALGHQAIAVGRLGDRQGAEVACEAAVALLSRKGADALAAHLRNVIAHG